MSTDLEQLKNTFLEEATEHLQELEQGLLRVEEDPSHLEPFQGVFRAAHSIKGGSGLFGFEAITRLTHSLENVLDRMRKATLEATSTRVDVLLRSVDRLRGLLDDARSDRPDAEPPLELIQELTDLLGDPVVSAPTQSSRTSPTTTGPVDYRVVFAPAANAFVETTDPLLLLRNLGKRGKVLRAVAHPEQLPPLHELDPTRCYLWWEIEIRSEMDVESIEAVFDFARDYCKLEVTVLNPAQSNLHAAIESGHFPFSTGYAAAVAEYLAAEQEVFSHASLLAQQMGVC